jgi:hypothetical protein
MPTAEEREQMRRWLDNWRRTGPLLDAERHARIAALTDEEAWRESQSLLTAWEPGMTGDNGEGLSLFRDVFSRWPGAAR